MPQPVTYGSPPEDELLLELLDEEELLELEELDDELLDEDEEELDEELLELDEEELDELLELDEELLTTGPTEHQADVVKLFVGKEDREQVKLPVRSA